MRFCDAVQPTDRGEKPTLVCWRDIWVARATKENKLGAQRPNTVQPLELLESIVGR